MPILPRNNSDIISIAQPTSSALYVDGRTTDNGIYVDGKIKIEGMPQDLQTTIEDMQTRLDKLERFYERVVVDAQEVVDAAESAENKDEWKERVFRIAEEVGLKKGEDG